jgi:Sugar phosphate permease
MELWHRGAETPAKDSSLQLGEAAMDANQPAQVPKRAWLVLAMLCFVYVINFLDRQLMPILAKPIQDSLHFSDGQLGLIGGFYFALVYCFISIPIGFLADKTSRSKVLAASCAIWSMATMSCGLAANFLQFAIARMTVGFGEAGGVPPSYAIISDYFPRHRRGTALGIFNTGPGIGAALGVAFGATIAAAFSWRYAFIVLGGVGIVAAIAVLLIVREPPRGGLDTPSAQPAAKSGFWDTFAMFFSRKSLVLAALGGGATQIITYGLQNFAVLFLMREKGMTLGEVAAYYSLVVLFGMTGAMIIGGALVDGLTKRWKVAYALIPTAGLVLAVPFFLAFITAPTWSGACWFLVVTVFLNHFFLSSNVTLVQQEVRPDQRVLSGALLLLVMNFIGLGLGPTFVGAASDFFRASHPGHSLQIALCTLVPFYLVAISLFLALARVLRRENRRATRLVGESVE